MLITRREFPTVVDLITIVLYAALLRFVFYYVYKTYLAFPWDQSVYAAFMAFSMAAMLVVVPKPGAILLWTITWVLLDYFFQRGVSVYLLGYTPIPILAEIVFWIMNRWGDDLRSVLVGTMVYQAGHSIWTWITYNEVWFIPPYPLNVFLVVAPVSVLIGNNAGAYLGNLVGKRLRKLAGICAVFWREFQR